MGIDMVQESKKLETPTDTEAAQDNLVKINKSKKQSQVLEINKQMSSVEASITQLNKKLNDTNKQIKADVMRLNESDAEITDKVAETYKQLGSIEATFQQLNRQSSKINSELNQVNATVKSLEKSSADALNQAIDQQSHVNDEFKQVHADIIDRAEKLSKKATSISSKLSKSIKDNSKALSELEARIVTELENIAQSSEQRDTRLDHKISANNDELSSQKAKMMLMQSVDEALDKRASALETTSAELLKDSAKLKDASQMLNVLTAKLSADVEALELHTASLAEQNQQQQGFIEALQEKTSTISHNLLALATLENKHFRTLAASSLLLLIAILVVFIYGEYMRNADATIAAQNNTQVNEQVSSLQTEVKDEQMASQTFHAEIASLQHNMVEIQKEMQDMNDQVESLDGRVQYLAPLYNFGSDNTIHGSQWLKQLKPELFSIKIATVATKQDLYEIAQRYNYYLDQDLAYFETADKQYTLIYGGQFESDQQLSETLRRMPRYMGDQRLGAISNSEILQQIKL